MKSPEAGKENAVESWRAIFQNVNRSTATGDLKKEKKGVAWNVRASHIHVAKREPEEEDARMAGDEEGPNERLTAGNRKSAETLCLTSSRCSLPS